MKAQDFMSRDNNRAEAIRRIQALCDHNGYEYEYTEKEFVIKLPDTEPIPISGARATKTRPEIDTSNWGPTGPVEGEDQQLPPVEPLEEGTPPDES